MRVISWNIEWHNNQRAIVDELIQLNPDICLLYELDVMEGKPKSASTFDMIKSALGYEGRFVQEFSAKKAKDVGTGNAIFSRYPIKSYVAVDLPFEKPSLRHPQTYPYKFLQDKRFGGGRKAQVFSVFADGVYLTVAAAHLELLTSGWTHHRTQLEAVFDASELRPNIVAGDFNNVQGSLTSALWGKPRTNGEVPKVREWLEGKGLYDPFTDLTVTGGKYGIKGKIDWLAADNSLLVKNAKTVWTDISDHAYLLADYDINLVK